MCYTMRTEGDSSEAVSPIVSASVKDDVDEITGFMRPSFTPSVEDTSDSRRRSQRAPRKSQSRPHRDSHVSRDRLSKSGDYQRGSDHESELEAPSKSFRQKIQPYHEVHSKGAAPEQLCQTHHSSDSVIDETSKIFSRVCFCS